MGNFATYLATLFVFLKLYIDNDVLLDAHHFRSKNCSTDPNITWYMGLYYITEFFGYEEVREKFISKLGEKKFWAGILF